MSNLLYFLEQLPFVFIFKEHLSITEGERQQHGWCVSSSDFSKTATDVSGDTVLSKKVHELSKVVSGLIDTNKKQEQKIIDLEKNRLK